MVAELDDAGLARRRPTAAAPALLVLLHAPFEEPVGGTEHHVRDLVRAVALPRVVVAVPQGFGLSLTEIPDGRLECAVRFRLPLREAPVLCMLDRREIAQALGTVVGWFGVAAAHVHHLFHWPVNVWRVLAERGVPYVVTVHDYYCICPNWTLFDATRDVLCCTDPTTPAEARTACLRALYDSVGLAAPADPVAYLAAHRAEYGRLLAAAHRVFTPSSAARDVVSAVYDVPAERFHVVPHGYAAQPETSARITDRDGVVRIALLGQVADPIKGARAYLPLLDRTRALAVEWHVFGDVERLGFGDTLRALALGPRLRVHGPYRRDDIRALLTEARIDLAVLLPPWPETFSYTLSEAFGAGVPVVASSQGALADRVRTTGAGLVVHGVDEAVAAVSGLVGDPDALRRLQEAARAYRDRPLGDMAADYRAVYGEMLSRGLAPAPPGGRVRRRLIEAYRAAAVPPPPLEPAPHHRRWWYPYYLPMAPLIPLGMRAWARRLVSSRRTDGPPSAR